MRRKTVSVNDAMVPFVDEALDTVSVVGFDGSRTIRGHFNTKEQTRPRTGL